MNKDYIPFSIRDGYENPKPIQREKMDDNLRNSLWNIFHEIIHSVPLSTYSKNDFYYHIVKKIFMYFLKESWQRGTKYFFMEEQINNIFKKAAWYTVYNLIEYIIDQWNELTVNKLHLSIPAIPSLDHFIAECNMILEKENSTYRIIEGLIVEIQSKEETLSIEKSMKGPFSGVNQHMRKALTLFADRKNPDYQSCVHQCSNALESLIKEITDTDNSKVSLGILIKKLPIQHQAFKEAINKLYGFVSDAKGIRHGQSGELLEINQNTARYMLVIYSAFINYIISECVYEKSKR